MEEMLPVDRVMVEGPEGVVEAIIVDNSGAHGSIDNVLWKVEDAKGKVEWYCGTSYGMMKRFSSHKDPSIKWDLNKARSKTYGNNVKTYLDMLNMCKDLSFKAYKKDK